MFFAFLRSRWKEGRKFVEDIVEGKRAAMEVVVIFLRGVQRVWSLNVKFPVVFERPGWF